ncbi:MAG: ABC transporter ATP-binding protein [Spirochaetaceae bacterium]|nr:ABC transporter ATP-binding protein [Spirochaetaceae bacterium]
MERPILEVKNISIDYPISIGTVAAVRDVSFSLEKGEALGIVGESGCGKSTLGLSFLRLLRPPGRIVNGDILYHGKNIIDMNQKELLKLRGQNIAMVFQNPLTSLDPLYSIEDQFYETMKEHEPRITRKEAAKRAGDVLESLSIDKDRLYEFPHQLSGGMRQRIMIGLGLILNPDLIIADEPTTSLDVIVEAGFIDLLARLRKDFNLSIILISHNLGLVAEMVDRIMVMYGGKIMELGTAQEIFSTPLHPYTVGLIGCVPNIKLDQEKLVSMPGNPPDLVNPPKGCRFSPRCPKAMDICHEQEPELIKHKNGQQVACWLYK